MSFVCVTYLSNKSVKRKSNVAAKKLYNKSAISIEKEERC